MTDIHPAVARMFLDALSPARIVQCRNDLTRRLKSVPMSADEAVDAIADIDGLGRLFAISVTDSGAHIRAGLEMRLKASGEERGA